MKNKHLAEDDEDDGSLEVERQEAKRLKFDKDHLEEDEEEEEDEENDEDDDDEYEEGKFSPDPIVPQHSSSSSPQSSTDVTKATAEGKSVEEPGSDQGVSSCTTHYTTPTKTQSMPYRV